MTQRLLGAVGTSPDSAACRQAISAFWQVKLAATALPTRTVAAAAETFTVSTTCGSGDADTGDAVTDGVGAGVTAA